MGYTHNTNMSQQIPLSNIQKSAGTWAASVTSNIPGDSRSAADASFTLMVPLALSGAESGLLGAKIQSVEFWYLVATAALDDFATVEIDQVSLGASATGAALEITIDADHDTAAERKTAELHHMTVSIDHPVFCEDGEFYYLVMVVDAAAASVFTILGAQVNFTLRL